MTDEERAWVEELREIMSRQPDTLWLHTRGDSLDVIRPGDSPSDAIEWVNVPHLEAGDP